MSFIFFKIGAKILNYSIFLLFFVIIFSVSKSHLFGAIQYDMKQWGGSVHIVGEEVGDDLGFALALCDFDGDGTKDILAGAPNAEQPGFQSSGKLYVIYGDASLSDTVFLPSSNVLEIRGENNNDMLGAVIKSGYIDEDGYEDILLGLPNSDNETGKIYIIYGRSRLTGIKKINDLARLTVLGASSGERFGNDIGLGDFNHDGVMDLVVGAPWASTSSIKKTNGIVYVCYGVSEVSGIKNIQNIASVTIRGSEGTDRLGYSVTSADFNIDGVDDLIVSAPWADSVSLQDDRGIVYVFFGGTEIIESGELSVGGYKADVEIIGRVQTRQFGSTLNSFDVNNDFYKDIICGAPETYKGSTGEISVILSRKDPAPLISLAKKTEIPFLVLQSEQARDLFGTNISVGDFNRDGLGDYLIGASSYDPPEGKDFGRGYLVYGMMTSRIARVIDAQKAYIKGSDAGDKLGSSMALGDVNKDNTLDLVFGAPNAGPPGKSSGTLYVIFGGLPYATDFNPEKNQKEVPVNTNLKFTLADNFPEIDGLIDISSIKVEVSKDTFSVADTFFHVTPPWPSDIVSVVVNLPDSFNYNQTINVSIEAKDQDKHSIPSEKYKFYTIEDHIGPKLSGMAPPDTEKFVPIFTDISVLVQDAVTGVKKDSLKMFLSHSVLDSDSVRTYITEDVTDLVTFSTLSKGYKLVYQDSLHYFLYGDKVIVNIVGEDFAGNPVEDPDSWYFITVDKDTIPPEIAYHGFNPDTNSVVNPDDYNSSGISFIVLDEQSGMNFLPDDSIPNFDPKTQMNLLTPRVWRKLKTPASEDTIVEISPYVRYSWLDKPMKLTGVYRPSWGGQPDFQYNEQVQIRIVAEDIAWNPKIKGHNVMDTLWNFSCFADKSPPEVSEFVPSDNALIKSSHEVGFTIQDVLSGVDEDFLTFLIDSSSVLQYSTREYINGIRHMKIHFIPEDTLLLEGGKHEALVNARDRVGNWMYEPKIWHFFVVPDTLPPLINLTIEVQKPDSLWDKISGQEPLRVPGDSIRFNVEIREDREIDIGIDPETINFSLVDEIFGTKTPLVIGGVPMLPTVTITTASGTKYAFTYVPEKKLSIGYKKIVASSRDKSLKKNFNEQTLRFRVTGEVPENKPDPPIITPGEKDDINDASTIMFKGTGTGTFRIFNRLNELLYEKEIVADPISNQFIVIWNGVDNAGKLVESGLYIYQFSKGKKFYHGTIAVAR